MVAALFQFSHTFCQYQEIFWAAEDAQGVTLVYLDDSGGTTACTQRSSGETMLQVPVVRYGPKRIVEFEPKHPAMRTTCVMAENDSQPYMLRVAGTGRTPMAPKSGSAVIPVAPGSPGTPSTDWEGGFKLLACR